MINALLSFWDRYILILGIFLCLTNLSIGQEEYDARFQLATLDTTAAIACYDLEIANAGNEPWTLASYNIALFYDARAACYRSDSLLPPGFLYRADNVNNSIVGGGLVMDSGLSYEDSLGFIRLGLTFVEEGMGMTLDTSGTWYPTIRICFDLKLDSITSPNTCLKVNFSDDSSRTALNVFPDIVQLWTFDNATADVQLNQTYDVIPNANYNSCFVLAENNESLCSDGIDNDEDGLLDCMDDECSPGNLSATSEMIECFDPQGRIIIAGANEGTSFSINGGLSFITDTIFENLSAGTYDLLAIKNNVQGCSFMTTLEFSEPDCSETSEAACTDGLDNDGDGLIDCMDENCQPLIDEVITVQPVTCPALDDGLIDFVTTMPNIEFSIDSGITYQSSPVFENITPGEYNLVIRNNLTLCENFYILNPLIITPGMTCVLPDEVCDDGMDNDGDGLVDCTDSDCQNSSDCLEVPVFFVPNIISPSSAQNNVFRIQSAQILNIQSLTIYDRWGGQVFIQENISSADNSHGWNGSQMNKIVKSGVYIYHIRLNVNDQIVHSTGDITVIN